VRGDRVIVAGCGEGPGGVTTVVGRDVGSGGVTIVVGRGMDPGGTTTVAVRGVDCNEKEKAVKEVTYQVERAG